MKTFVTSCLILFFTSISTVFLSVQPSAAWAKIRNIYAFDRQTKWDCFYRTTTPVKGLNPAIWRHDQFGNLLMAGLNYNCKGCLCYTFDHRYPISELGDIPATGTLISLMSSIHNCQALSFRTNALKGSNEDNQVKSIINRFGCDSKTMSLFEDKDHMGARAIEKYYLSPERIEQFHQHYTDFVNGNNFLNPKSINQSKEEYFNLLNKNAEVIKQKIISEYNTIIALLTSYSDSDSD